MDTVKKIFKAAKWIWADGEVKRNRYLRFIRDFDYTGGSAALCVTANFKYYMYLNGEYVGRGPARAYPFNYKCDEYNIEPYLKRGINRLSFIAQHTGEANMHSVPGLNPGLLVAAHSNGRLLFASDESFLTADYPALETNVPKVSMQLPYFEEQFDMRKEDDWKVCGELNGFLPAAVLAGASSNGYNITGKAEISAFTQKKVFPKRIIRQEYVESIPYIISFDLRETLCDNVHNEIDYYIHSFTNFEAFCEKETYVKPIYLEGLYKIYINGTKYELRSELIDRSAPDIKLNKGVNYFCIENYGRHHGYQRAVCLDSDGSIKFSNFSITVMPLDLKNFDTPPTGQPWVILPKCGMSDSEAQKISSGAVCGITHDKYARRFNALHKENIFARSYTDKIICQADFVAGKAELLSGSDYAEIKGDGRDMRVLLDFGAETVGCHTFEAFAEEGTIIDFHNFEFIQPDGRENYIENMNNSLRVVCRGGYNKFTSLQRRGFQYSYVTVRNCKSIKIKGLSVIEMTYPQLNRGVFFSSDYRLNKIWETGSNSLRLCSEDTYTDCPTIEQVFWIGDMRNEALVDWVLNGDSRLWLHSLKLAADSLEITPLISSHLPSGWVNILPNWAFLWQQSVYEYYFYTGDEDNLKALYPAVKKNTEGILKYINADGLFDITAWNMFDWAEMDQPGSGVVTHQNCFAVRALGFAAKIAEATGDVNSAKKWKKEAKKLKDAVNLYLWNDEKQAYCDCVRRGKNNEYVMSSVFSQQTQVAAYISGVADGKREKSCIGIILNPPEGFVKAGSPFFEFFLLEMLERENKRAEIIKIILKDWGFMTDTGCTTFWEMWSVVSPDGRLTRSHCHGWSSAPVYFLSEHLLGVKPLLPGYKRVLFNPVPATEFCRGEVPTPYGNIKISWKREGKKVSAQITAPEEIEILYGKNVNILSKK